MNKIKILSILFLSAVFLSLANVSPVFAGAQLFNGDFVSIANINSGTGGWHDSESFNPGEIAQIRVIVRNIGDAPSNHVQVYGHIPEVMSTTHIFSATIKGNYFGSVPYDDTATATIRDGSIQTFRYEPGHAQLFGVTDIYNCPTGCSISDNIASTGLDIGRVGSGESVQIAFKARLSNLIAATATLTPTTPPATATPTPTSTTAPAATATPTPTTSVSSPGIGGTLQCPAGFTATIVGTNMICIQNNNNNTNNNTNTQNQTQTNNQSVNITNSSSSTASAPQGTVLAAASTLPKTGLPLTVWGLMSLVPIGLKVKKFAKGFGKDALDSPRYIWEERQFKK